MRRRLVEIVFVAGALALPLVPTPAIAAVTSSVVDGVLTVVGRGADEVVVIGCRADGTVRIGAADPDTGPAQCAELTGIDVSAGGGEDEVDLTQLEPADFPLLTSIVVRGGDGDDSLLGSPLGDDLRGEAGNDLITVGAGDTNAVDGGTGLDVLIELHVADLRADRDTLTGTGVTTFRRIERLTIEGTGGADVIDLRGFGGEERIRGLKGADRLLGGPGASEFDGGPGADNVAGGGGDDLLFGGAGPDTLRGQSGADRMDGGAGTDTCNGGPGLDLERNC